MFFLDIITVIRNDGSVFMVSITRIHHLLFLIVAHKGLFYLSSLMLVYRYSSHLLVVHTHISENNDLDHRNVEFVQQNLIFKYVTQSRCRLFIYFEISALNPLQALIFDICEREEQ